MPETVGFVIKLIADFLGPRSLVAITGGGGKTTLMEALASRLSECATVVVTTTTKLFADGAKNVLFGDSRTPDDGLLRAALARKKRVTLANRSQDGKLIGLAPEAIDAMAHAGIADHILVEADGAKHRPFKAYESYEPVVPSTATCQIVVVGTEIFIEPASEKNSFRFDLLRARTGIEPGQYMPLGTIARMLESRDEYLRGAPPAAKRLLVVNKCDLFPDAKQIKKIADDLAGLLTAYDALMLVSVARDECYEYRPLERRA